MARGSGVFGQPPAPDLWSLPVPPLRDATAPALPRCRGGCPQGARDLPGWQTVLAPESCSRPSRRDGRCPRPDPHDEVARRRTFAIISHPDAGKTTLTEKLLLYGGAVHLAGSVKQRRAERHATSDWMAIERERGISIATSVMQFAYRGCQLNLLDTPGPQRLQRGHLPHARGRRLRGDADRQRQGRRAADHQAVRGLPRCGGIPIVTFINKMDRHGRDPLDLLDEIERVLGMPCSPAELADRRRARVPGRLRPLRRSRLLRFERGESARAQGGDAGEPASTTRRCATRSATHAHQQLLDELELLDGAGTRVRRRPLPRRRADAGLLRQRADQLRRRAVPRPLPRAGAAAAARARPPTGAVAPDAAGFSGFVFKIQANMDPQHRDRIAFLRVCSGRFVRGMEVVHVRTGKTLSLNKPLQFLAQERTLIEEAFAGDIVGLWDPGVLRIGDTSARRPDGASSTASRASRPSTSCASCSPSRSSASSSRRGSTSSPRRAPCRSSSTATGSSAIRSSAPSACCSSR